MVGRKLFGKDQCMIPALYGAAVMCEITLGNKHLGTQHCNFLQLILLCCTLYNTPNETNPVLPYPVNQYICSTPAVYLQYICRTPAVYLQYTCSISAVHLQYICSTSYLTVLSSYRRSYKNEKKKITFSAEDPSTVNVNVCGTSHVTSCPTS
jgi:hypothetical protein